MEQAKTMRLFSLMSVWFTFQFGISYYTIFEVEWLGWDLVEPFTYSITQGTGLLGVYYVMKNRGANTGYTDLAEHMQRKRQRKWIKKYDFDLQRYYFLEQKIKRIDEELASWESSMLE
jgi:hypothetical protein